MDRLNSRIVVAMGVALVATLAARAVRAQSGGASGTATTGTLQSSDFFLTIQKEQGVNLNERDRGRFLNRANCDCRRTAWVKAVLLGSATAKAATIPGNATVSLYIGDQCNVAQSIGACKQLVGGVPFPQFRQSGISVETTVYDLAQVYSINPGTTTATGGASGSGGSGGSGGTGAAGGGGGTGGGGGGGSGGNASSGGSAGTITATGCDRPSSTQTLWLFVGTTTDLSMQLGSASQGFAVDPQPPPALAVAAPQPVNEALLVNWEALSSVSVPDLLGYQVLCARGTVEDQQVFRTGTFTSSFDYCSQSATGTGLQRLDPAYVCSDLLSTATTSYRVKILENGVTYVVGVAAVDRQGNASTVTVVAGSPVLTRDFYYTYRHGDPQGEASGGFCAVGGPAAAGNFLPGVFSAICAVVIARRRPLAKRRRS